MICYSCMRIFELDDDFSRSVEPILHHVNTQSFVSSVTAGCPICRAILSELDDPQKLLLDPNMISSTKCSIRGVGVGGRVSLYCLDFVWESPGIPPCYRRLVVKPYRTIQPYLPCSPLEAHRGWTDQALDMVKTWIHSCREQHPKCQVLSSWRTSGLTFQPKRLVDIGPAGGMMWRLILRGDSTVFPIPYVTLSHRWSPSQQFKLVGKNEQVYKDGQPLGLLPRVFQDAIKVVQALGIRYMWVDCLCIIQDSLSDWEIESLEMCKIYTNSVCNISITGFEDNSTGFLEKTCDYVPLPCQLQPTWAPRINGGWCVLDPFFWWAQVTKAPLAKRGWVFQERYLAPRVIHFGPEQLLWECASLDACEAFPQGLPMIVKSPTHTGFKRMDFLFENNMQEALLPGTSNRISMNEEDRLYHWCQIVQAYTRTSLTKPNDKLIALAGVAQLMSLSDDPTNVTSSKRYLAGLFKQHLLLMLEWHTDGKMFLRIEPAGVRPSQYRAPSWSWASIDGRVFYDYLPRRINNDELWGRKASWELFLEHLSQNTSHIDPSYWPAPNKCLDWKPLVFDMKSSATTMGESPFGQVLDGNVELTGMPSLVQDTISRSIRNPSLRPVLVYLDAPTDSEHIKSDTLLLPLRCLQLRGPGENDPFYWVTGLLLETVNADESTFQRCGMLTILSTDGIREIGIELTESPFTAKYSDATQLRAIKLI
ncbi:heterokaryon incompatibility protein-domain-containing protein [Ustulina deusta]|nr:heterokaryon incompatibility protein-domain-containing protein [Ustulina deusta]